MGSSISIPRPNTFEYKRRSSLVSIKWLFGGNMQRLRRLLAFCLVILLEGYYHYYSEGLFKCGVVAEEAAAPTITTGYPQCWIRKGECLDNNEPPLREAIKPQINHNVIGESIG